MSISPIASYNPVAVVSSETKRVLWCSVTGSLPVLVPQAVVICGKRAELLYTSISGHSMSETPDKSSPVKSRLARATLAAGRSDPESILINEVIAQWGDYIRPWFGCHMIDSNGNIILDTEAYNTIFDLSTNRPGIAVDVEFVNGDTQD